MNTDVKGGKELFPNSFTEVPNEKLATNYSFTKSGCPQKNVINKHVKCKANSTAGLPVLDPVPSWEGPSAYQGTNS